MRRFIPLLAYAALLLIGCGSNSGEPAAGGTTGGGGKPAAEDYRPWKAGDKPKIGFLVKSASEPWFQTEWKFADEAASKLGFELIKIETKEGSKVMDAMDQLGTQNAHGVIICTPDTRLGTAIVEAAAKNKLRLFTVDDRLVDANDKPLANVPYLGISAKEIGGTVGQACADEMKKRGWNVSETGVLAIVPEELETARLRIDGASEKITAAGVKAEQIYRAPWKKFDVGGAIEVANPVITQHSEVKHWLVISSNDDGVVGGVRALEEKGFKAADVIGVGINGTTIEDFEKPEMTGFFASVLLSARTHGYKTSEMMFNWITKGEKPPMETYTSGTLIDRTNYKAKRAEEGLN